MKLIRDIHNLRGKLNRPVLTIGIFDGVHLAHQKIIKEVVRQAMILKGTSTVLTFSSHPVKIFGQGASAGLITSVEHRIDLIRRLGIKVCVLADFNEQLYLLSAQDFIKRILVDTIGVNYVVVGEGFRFGRARGGSFLLLKRLSKRYGFRVEQIKSIKVNGRIISSTRIRTLIQSGKIDRANRLLGRKFSIYGQVKKGSARGRILGYPTANIAATGEIVPGRGVYAVLVKLDNRILAGILNIGLRPTFRAQQPVDTIEVHIFNFRKKIYARKVEVFFVQRIRSEKKFVSQQALLARIKQDTLAAKRILHTRKLS